MKTKRYLAVSLALLLQIGCSDSLDEEPSIQQAQAYLDKGQPRFVVVVLKNVLREDPKNAQARYLLGLAHLQLGDAAAAEKELTRAREFGVVQASVMPYLARALLAQGKYQSVEELPIADLPKGQEQGEVLAAIGLAKSAQGKMDSARRSIEEAFGMAPQSAYVSVARARLLIAEKDYAGAKQILDGVVARNDRYAPAWSAFGNLYRLQKKYADAEQAYSKAMETRLANASDRLNRAMMRIELRKYDQAQEDVDFLLKRYPKNPGANFAQGLIYLNAGKPRDAVDFLRSAVLGDPTKLYPKYYLGVAHLKLGNVEQAAEYAEGAFEMLPAAVAVRRLLAEVRLRERDFPQVEKLVRPIVLQRKGDLRARELLAFSLLGRGRTEQALPLLRELMETEPDSSIAKMRYGTALLTLGRDQEGIKYLQAAVAEKPNLDQAWLLLIRYLVRQGQINKAMQIAESYRKAQPNSPRPWVLIGELRRGQGDISGARAAFEQASSVEPGNPDASHGLASLAMAAKNYADARARLEAVLADHKDHLATLLSLALLDAIENKPELMQSHLQRAVEAHPDALAPRILLARFYLLRNEASKVTSLFVDLPNKVARNPEVLGVTAFSELALGEYRKAEVTLKELIEQRPKSAQLRFLLGWAFAGQNDLVDMKKTLQKALQLDPKHLRARLALARLALREGDEGEARAHLDKLKKIAPDKAEVLYLEALLADRSKRPEVAGSLLEKVFDQAPNSRTLLALARQKWALGETREAIKLQEDWLRKKPGDLAVSLALAGAYSNEGATEKAVESYRKVLASDSDNVPALNGLAWLLREKDPIEALEYAERAAALASDVPEVLDTLAMVQSANGESSAAERSIERALTRSPNDPEMRYHAAVIAEASGKADKALRILDKLLAEEKRNFPQRQAAEALRQKLSKH